jgi:hypothetical protein
VIKLLNDNSGFIIAVATCALVGVTMWNIYEAGKSTVEIRTLAGQLKELAGETTSLARTASAQLGEAKGMNVQTKRMADNSIEQLAQAKRMADASLKQFLETKRMVDSINEQFKIKSYPGFFVVPEKVSVDSDKLTQKFSVENKGEVVARELSVLVINAYQEQPFHPFLDVLDAPMYEYQGEKSMGNVEINMPPSARYNISTESKFPPTNSITTLKTVLIFVRFKVPYDTKYSYETYSFALRDDKSLSLVGMKDTRKIVEANKREGWKNVSTKQRSVVEEFLIDF